MKKKYGPFLPLIEGINEKNYKKIFIIIYIYLAYWLGIIQDFYLGVEYLLNLFQKKSVTGSFPFMFGWTVIMLWGFVKPIERRAILLITGILVTFMFAEKLILLLLTKYDSNPYIHILGMLLWTSSYFLAGRLSTTKQSSQ